MWEIHIKEQSFCPKGFPWGMQIIRPVVPDGIAVKPLLNALVSPEYLPGQVNTELHTIFLDNSGFFFLAKVVNFLM